MNALNQWLSSLAKKEKIMIYVVILILFPLITYFLFDSDLEDEIARKEANVIKSKKTLASYKRSVNGASLKKLKQQVQDEKSKVETFKEVVKNKKDQLYANALLSVNEKEWATILENVLDKSIKKDVTITELSISSKEIPYVGEVSFLKSVKISGYGRYLNIESLLRYIESNERYFKLESLNIKQEGTKSPNFEVTFNLLGVTK